MARIISTKPGSVNNFFAYLLLTYGLSVRRLMTAAHHLPLNIFVFAFHTAAHGFIQFGDFTDLDPVFSRGTSNFADCYIRKAER